MTTEPTPTPGQPLPTEIPSTQDERTMALLCHLGGILTGFIVPLIIWLIKKDQSRFVDDQGKEALNFQLTLLIAYVVSTAAMCIYIGFVLWPATWIVSVVFGIMGSMAANKGEVYRYPVNIRFLK